MIHTRKEWGARYGLGDPNPGPKLHVIGHHTYRPVLPATATVALEATALRIIESVHVEDNGWEGIAYNHLIFQSGRIWEGRGWGRRGAHAGPGNAVSEGIAFVLDGTVELPTAAAMGSFRWLVAEGIRLGAIAPAYKLSGHRDWMPRDCPGDLLYGILPTLRHDWMPSILAPSGELAIEQWDRPKNAPLQPPELEEQ